MVVDPRLVELSRFIVADTVSPEFLATMAKVSAALRDVPHALIGGQAVFFRGYRRFSKDIDIGVAVSRRDAAKALVDAGLRVIEGARLVDPETRIEVDVVRMARAIVPRLRDAEVVDVGRGVAMRVIDLESLVALKVKIGRAQDEADVVQLLKAGATPQRAIVADLLRKLGESEASYDRLVERAERERALPPPGLDDEDPSI